ncbi:MAG: hypothetical protein KC423_29760, partial [Anaerolineales bacterium]|nr:hypothetical protein [Anaerolineales bacterium]
HLISITLEGAAASPPEHNLRSCSPGDFCDATHYPVSLFNLVLNLYAIPFGHAGFAPLRESLHQRWEQTLARTNEFDDFDEARATQNRAEFLKLLDLHFNESEIDRLCFDLGIDFENLPDKTKVEKARELILYCKRNGRLNDLQTEVREKRSHVEWPKI